MPTRRHLLLGAGAALALSALPAGAGEVKVLSGRAFGTRWRVTLAKGAGNGLADEIAGILAGIDEAMSPFREDSEISRFNRSGDTGWQAASRGFGDVATAAFAIAAETDGAFDPTVGPAVRRYGFGPIDGVRAGSHGAVATRGGMIRKSDPVLSVDLCAIAKGYAVDLISAHLAARGHEGALVDIGGDMRGVGRAAGGRAWRVGIEDPVNGGIHAIVDLSDMGLATSGNAVHFYEIGGRRYSHVIDPATGAPVENRVASVSVLAPDAMRADALATALMVMGPEKGLAFAERNAVPALFLLREAGGVREIANDLFRARIAA